MNKVIQFPRTKDESAACVLSELPPGSHTVQFYERDEFLLEAVGKFLRAGLERDERLLVICTREHADALLERLAPLNAGHAAEGRLTLLDARETLAKFMVGDMPDPRSLP